MSLSVPADRAKGFTLVELMLVLVIAAVLLALAAPSMIGLLERNRIQTSAETLFGSLMLTRTEALKRNQAVIMCKSTDGANCDSAATLAPGEWERGWLVYADANANLAPDPNEILRVTAALKSGDRLRVSGSDFDYAVTYNTDGTASGGESFVFCNAAAEIASGRELDVDLTGRPKMNRTTTNCSPP